MSPIVMELVDRHFIEIIKKEREVTSAEYCRRLEADLGLCTPRDPCIRTVSRPARGNEPGSPYTMDSSSLSARRCLRQDANNAMRRNQARRHV